MLHNKKLSSNNISLQSNEKKSFLLKNVYEAVLQGYCTYPCYKSAAVKSTLSFLQFIHAMMCYDKKYTCF